MHVAESIDRQVRQASGFLDKHVCHQSCWCRLPRASCWQKEIRMPPVQSRVELSLILRDARLKGQAKRILYAPPSPTAVHGIGIFLVILLGAVAIGIQKPSLPVYSAIFGLGAWGMYVSIELWSVRCRLNALIQLLSLGENLEGVACSGSDPETSAMSDEFLEDAK
jgi:hypothetical protein